MENENKILIIGSHGLVGSRFEELSDFRQKAHAPKFAEFDLNDMVQVEAIFKSFNFSTIINFAAFSDVDAAESERGNKSGEVWKINVEGVKNLAEAIKAGGKKPHLIHISTDMVFSGDDLDKGPYDESHLPEEDLSKLTWYGYTKAEAERVVKNVLGDETTIIRINYPIRAKFSAKLDYLRKPLSLFDQGKLYPVFSDQQISISFIDEVAYVLDKIIKNKHFGTFHASSSDLTTPYELISYMLKKTRNKGDFVQKISIDEYIESTKAPKYRYAKYGGLKVQDTENILEVKFSSCKQIVDKLVRQGIE